MRRLLVIACVALIGMLGVVVAVDRPDASGPVITPRVAQAPPRAAAAPVPAATPAAPAAAVPKGSSAKATPVDAAVKSLTDSLLTSYQKGDAKSFAAAFTTDGEYLDPKGAVFHGRQAIENEFAAYFTAVPGTIIEMDLVTTRAIGTGVIAADGTTRFKKAPTAAVVLGQCHLVCTREGDELKIASLQEADVAQAASHHDQVSQLAWLQGEWIGEGPRSHTHFSCRWDPSGNYLLRDFSIEVGGKKTVSGTQRIGYDPITGHLKIWVFDSAGGYSDGHFNRDGERWIVRTSGVTSDGRLASTTAVIERLDDHRMSSETIDRVINGDRVADTDKQIIARKANPREQARTSDIQQ